VARDRRGLVGLGDDPGPQAVAHVRGHRVDRPLVTVERQSERLPLGKPEVALEPPAQHVGPPVPPRGHRLVAGGASERRAGPPGGVGVALHLGQGDRRLGQSPVGERHAVPRVLPTLIDQPAGRPPLVLHVAVAVGVAGPGDPLQRGVHRRQERDQVVERRTPPPQLVHEHDEQGRGVDRPVIDIAVGQRQRRTLGEPHLVQDLAGLLVVVVPILGALEPGQGA
jgi:hypothetical protein